MPPASRIDPPLGDWLLTLWRHRRRLLLTAAVVAFLAAAYVAVAPRTWEASQAILIRNDASGRVEAPGKFRLDDEMKTTQETVLEVASSRSLLRSVLARVGPPADAMPATPWPSEIDIAEFRDAVSITPPRGAEFGKTEVFYLKVKDRDRQRALLLVSGVYDELQQALGRLRANVARSTLAELEKSVGLAESQLGEATERLAALEQQVGPDLIALRMLHQSPTGESDLYRTLTNSADELRQVRGAESQSATMLELLAAAKEDPLRLLSAPRELLDAHPALARLSEGLNQAQLRTAGLASKFTESHPLLIAARSEEESIRQDIFKEVEAAREGVVASAKLAEGRRQTLENQVAELRTRLDRLTSVRATYSNVAEEVDHRRTLLEETQRNLAQVRATQVAAATSQQLSPVDDPDGGTRPLGPSRASILLLGLAGGLAAGVGVVLLTVPTPRPSDSPERLFAGAVAVERPAARPRRRIGGAAEPAGLASPRSR
ncbi:MAG: hypothetical protein KJZ87_22250 [Thermoguttaceae bacterium]|nr:hypothetical protein [Thermoguttaceae bacterium]